MAQTRLCRYVEQPLQSGRNPQTSSPKAGEKIHTPTSNWYIFSATNKSGQHSHSHSGRILGNLNRFWGEGGSNASAPPDEKGKSLNGLNSSLARWHLTPCNRRLLSFSSFATQPFNHSQVKQCFATSIKSSKNYLTSIEASMSPISHLKLGNRPSAFETLCLNIPKLSRSVLATGC